MTTSVTIHSGLSSTVYDNAYLRICQSLGRMVPFHRSSSIPKIRFDDQKCSAFVSPRQRFPAEASVYSMLDCSNDVGRAMKSSANLTAPSMGTMPSSLERSACCFGFPGQSWVPPVVLIHPPQAEQRTAMVSVMVKDAG